MIRIPALLIACLAVAAAGDAQFVFDLTLVEGTGDKPMIVAWLEKPDGTFVRTLHMFSKDRKYYKDMLVWSAARDGSAEDDKAVDAVAGATPSWAGHQLVRVPVQDALSGGLVLRIEQRKDKGGHYKKRKVTLAADWPGVTLEKDGYIAKLVVTVER